MGSTKRFLGMMIVLLTVMGLAGPLFGGGEEGGILLRAKERTSLVTPDDSATSVGSAKEFHLSDGSKILIKDGKIKVVGNEIREPGKFVIVIDPGHPSEVSGGADANGIKEIDVNWDIGQALASALGKNPTIKVLVNRQEKTQMMTNQARAEFANQAQATLCLRLHCDFGAKSASGFTIYFPDTQGTVRGKTGPSEAVIAKSRLAAQAMHQGMVPRLAGVLPDGGVKTDRQTFVGAKNGGALIGSIFSEVPAVVVEMIYLNNPRDAAFITSPDGRQAMVEALLAGVDTYLETLSPKH